MTRVLGAVLTAAAFGLSAATTRSANPPFDAVASLDVPRYMGLWYQPARDYLWAIPRRPQMTADDNASVRAGLQAHGFDLSRLQAHGASIADSDLPR